MSMETVNTGVLDKNKEHYLRSEDKAEVSIASAPAPMIIFPACLMPAYEYHVRDSNHP